MSMQSIAKHARDIADAASALTPMFPTVRLYQRFAVIKRLFEEQKELDRRQKHQ